MKIIKRMNNIVPPLLFLPVKIFYSGCLVGGFVGLVIGAGGRYLCDSCYCTNCGKDILKQDYKDKNMTFLECIKHKFNFNQIILKR